MSGQTLPPTSFGGPAPGYVCRECGLDRAAHVELLGEVDRLRRELADAHVDGRRPSAATSAAATISGERPRAITRSFGAVAPVATTPRFEPRPLEKEPPRASFDPQPTPRALTSTPEQGLDFGAVARLDPARLDALPYGLITLDAHGRVIHYNDTEARLAGLPRDRVVGRSFFGEIAPCTRVREFQGRFEELVRDPLRVRVQTFDFVFRFANGEQQVSIVIVPARVRGQFNVALLRR